MSTGRSARLCALRFQRHTHEEKKKNIDLEATPTPTSLEDADGTAGTHSCRNVPETDTDMILQLTSHL
jgi:hypothetical protein